MTRLPTATECRAAGLPRKLTRDEFNALVRMSGGEVGYSLAAESVARLGLANHECGFTAINSVGRAFLAGLAMERAS